MPERGTVATEDQEATNKRELQSTKRELQTTKRELESTKRELQSTKRIKDTATEYADFGAPGNYTVTTSDDVKGNPKPIKAIYMRVLGNGELNLITDEGRWYLFASGAWKKVVPEQPVPGECEFCGHCPNEPNAAQW